MMTHLKLFWNGSYFEILEIYQNITDDELWELIHYLWFMAFDDLEISRFIWMIVCSNYLIHLPDDQTTNVNISKTKKKRNILAFFKFDKSFENEIIHLSAIHTCMHVSSTHVALALCTACKDKVIFYKKKQKQKQGTNSIVYKGKKSLNR